MTKRLRYLLVSSVAAVGGFALGVTPGAAATPTNCGNGSVMFCYSDGACEGYCQNFDCTSDFCRFLSGSMPSHDERKCVVCVTNN